MASEKQSSAGALPSNREKMLTVKRKKGSYKLLTCVGPPTVPLSYRFACGFNSPLRCAIIHWRAPVAQWIERLPPEQEVGRSNRPGCATPSKALYISSICRLMLYNALVSAMKGVYYAHLSCGGRFGRFTLHTRRS